jgi:hypothetical protein
MGVTLPSPHGRRVGDEGIVLKNELLDAESSSA